MVRRLIVHTLRPLVLLAAIVGLAVVAQQCEEPRTEAAPPLQSSQTRTVDWYYWLDTGNRQIQRARLDGSGVAETVVSNSEMSTTNDFALDPGGDYVYWVDDGHNQIRRKSADGTGSMETLVSAGISSPYRIAVDNSYVYWADTGNDTIKRAQTFGSHTVTTIADSSDGVSNVAAIALDGSYLYWADNGNQSVREVATFSPNTVTTLVSTGLSNPQDLEVGRNGSYVYVLDRNGTNSTVKRVATSGGHTVTTLASNTGDTPMDDPVALTLDPDNDFVYWLDMDDQAVRRVAADGATGTFETLTTSAGGDPTDLVVSPDGGTVYWLDNSGNQREAHRRRWVRHGSGRDHLGPQHSESDQRFPGNGDHRRLLHHRRGHSGRRLRHPPLGGRHRRHLPVGLLHLPPRRRRGPAHHRHVVLHQPVASPAPGRHRRRGGGAHRQPPTARPRPTCTWRRRGSTPSSWCGSSTRRTPPAASRPGCRPSPCCPAAT